MLSNSIVFGTCGTIIIALVCIIILLTRHLKILTTTMTFDRVQQTINQIDNQEDCEYTHPCDLLINIVDECDHGQIVENFIAYYLPVCGQEIRTPKLGTITPKRVLIDYSQVTANPKDSGAVFVYVYI